MFPPHPKPTGGFISTPPQKQQSGNLADDKLPRILRTIASWPNNPVSRYIRNILQVFVRMHDDGNSKLK